DGVGGAREGPTHFLLLAMAGSGGPLSRPSRRDVVEGSEIGPWAPRALFHTSEGHLRRYPCAGRVSVVGAFLIGIALFGLAQTPPCGAVGGTPPSTMLPDQSDTITGSFQLVLRGSNSAPHLYLTTQFGVVRTPLTPVTNPNGYGLAGVGLYPGIDGVIPIVCDCHQGWNAFDVAEATDGSARMVGAWNPYTQGGPPGSSGFSGLPAQVTQATGSNDLAFGQQTDLPSKVSGIPTAIYIGPPFRPSANK